MAAKPLIIAINGGKGENQNKYDDQAVHFTVDRDKWGDERMACGCRNERKICEKNEMVSAKIYGRFLRVEISLSLTCTRKCLLGKVK